jgi:hypothetical protein
MCKFILLSFFVTGTDIFVKNLSDFEGTVNTYGNIEEHSFSDTRHTCTVLLLSNLSLIFFNSDSYFVDPQLFHPGQLLKVIVSRDCVSTETMGA